MSSSSSPTSSTTPTPEWVLVIDDDAPVRQMVASCLSDEPVEVVTAANGVEALNLVAQRPTEPVLTLVDVLMPGIDGLTLSKRLRTKFKRGKIVIMSGHMSDVSWWPVELREIEFMVKPFRLATLLEHLASARSNYHGSK